MSGSSSSTSSTTKRVRPLRVVQVTGALVMAALEAFVLAEILYYYLHDGEQTLHGAVREWFEHLQDRAEYRADVEDTRAQIRDLPETG